MKHIALCEEERYLLREYCKTSPIALIRFKSQAILMREEGLLESQIARFVFRDERTIQRWISAFAKERISTIFSKKILNENAAKLTKEQKKEIAEVLQLPPSEQALPKQFWDVPQLRNYVKATFGVEYESVQSYHFLLEFSRLSFKYPDTFDRNRDETYIAKRMNEIYTEIEPLLTNASWEVFASDEVGLQMESLSRKAWLKKNQKTVVKVERSKQKQNYIGMLNIKNGRCHLYEITTGNQEEIIRSLERFLKEYPTKKICIIWDNATHHKGKHLREALTKGHSLERIHLINLPPYAPDHNPIEHVWKKAKSEIASLKYEAFDKTKSLFSHFITSSFFNYKI